MLYLFLALVYTTVDLGSDIATNSGAHFEKECIWIFAFVMG